MPEQSLDLRTVDGRDYVYDRLRHKFVALTPEEYVRQNFVSFLTGDLGYPAGLMANEVSLRLNGRLKRADTVVYDREGRPLVIIEYKSPDVEITQRVFDQALRYHIVLRVKWLVVSNGLRHFVCRIVADGAGVEFVRDLPRYQDL